MKPTAADIDQWRAAPTESKHLEFKAPFHGTPDDKNQVRDYCVAIANEEGGFLVYGVENKVKNGKRDVTGTDMFQDTAAMEKWLLDTCKFRVEVDAVDHPNGRVVVFRIPSRPQGTAYEIGGRYLMRAGSSLVGMSPDRLRQIFAEGGPHWGDMPVQEGLTDEEVLSLLDVQTFFALLKLPKPTSAVAAIERLEEKRLIIRQGVLTSITRLGALLLARRLEDFPEIARRAPRVVVYEGNDKLHTRIDRVGMHGYAVGFQGLVQYVMEQMPRREVVHSALRETETLIPQIVIRELAANALVHQDLSLTGTSPMIEIYKDRIEISNPGAPVVDANRFIDGYRSRNEHMAEVMRLFGICEEKGSGFDRVVTAAEESLLSAPDIVVGPERTHVVVFGYRAFSDMTSDERIRAAFQHCALKCVRREFMTNQSLRARFQLSSESSSTVSQVIASTEKAGLIKLDVSVGGSKRFARYLPFWA